MNEYNEKYTGYIENEPFDAYLQHPGLSSHRCMQLLDSPALYKWEKENPEEATDDMRMGTILHSAILEPESFANRVVYMPKFDRRSKVGKADYEAWRAQLPEHAIVVNEREKDVLVRMVTNCMKHPAARQLLAGSVKERSSYVFDEDLGIQLKARFDVDHEQAGILADVKKVRCAKADKFQRAIVDYRYHVQAAFYLSMANTLSHALGRGVVYDQFVWILCESEPPYATAVYYATAEMLEVGSKEVTEAIKRFQKCTLTGDWFAYPADPQPIDLPRWYQP